ncbi:hypothetical protein A4X06_0g8202 [Tilletia controversa]|uniref:Uncharacterized protein n=1 Tax=Tilletia controversa TaxID=13291 RepID=A0A8X7MLL2_9BASI|nr:hypothetical protein A4X06_0g8202 [Tilletia controversa]
MAESSKGSEATLRARRGKRQPAWLPQRSPKICTRYLRATATKHENVYEIPERRFDIPEGYVGNLTDNQHAKLRQIWAVFFDVLSKAKATADGAARSGAGASVEFETDLK